MVNMKDIVLKAISENGYALQFASHELQNNKDIVRKACSKNRHALEFASSNNKDVVFTNCGVKPTFFK